MIRHDATCPDRSRLQHLLEGRLTAADHATLARHLDMCEGCQRTLESLEAEARRCGSVDRPEEDGPALRRVIEELQHDRPVGATETTLPSSPTDWDPDLDFLDPPARPGELGKLGPYQVIGVIGRGGMGVVLKAFDPTLHRVVAIKVLHPSLATSGTARMRFLREARAAAAVSHDHVITIHAVDEFRGMPYLVMRFIAGLSLQDRIDRHGPLELREILRIGRQIASGLAAAHAQGLVHRDIKPANILLENGVERVKITDFGLARAADDASLTGSGVVAGTPQYMAPEQARGEPIDHRADLFSLGGVLYAMSTGRPPFRGSSTMGILRRVSDEDPPPIRDLNPDVPGWMAAIVERLHAKDPADRFATAAEVADLLGQHLIGLQRPTQPPGPARRWKTRKPLPVDELSPAGHQHGRWPRTELISAVLLVGLALLIFAIAPAFRGIALRMPETATAPMDPAETDAGGSAQVAADISTDLEGTTDPPIVRESRIFKPIYTGPIIGVAVSPDGRLAASAGAGSEAQIVLWDVASGRQVRTLSGHEKGVVTVAFTPDGQRLLSGSEDGTCRVWEVETGRELDAYDVEEGWVYSLAVSPDGRQAAIGIADWDYRGNRVLLWDFEQDRPTLECEGIAYPVMGLAYSPDGRHILGGGDRRLGGVSLWEARTGRLIRRFETPYTQVRSVAFSPDGRLAASGHWAERIIADKWVDPDHGIVILWDPETGEEVRRLRGHSGNVNAVAFSPDGRFLASGSGGRHNEKGYFDAIDNTIRLWDVETGRELARFEQAATIHGLAFSPDGRHILSGGRDGLLRLWEVPMSAPAAAPSPSSLVCEIESRVWALAFAPDGRTLAMGSGDGVVRLWERWEGRWREGAALKGHDADVRSLAFSPDGTALASGSFDATARLWDPATGRRLALLKGHRDTVNGVAFSPDGTTLASASLDGTVMLWDVSSGQELRTIRDRDDWVLSVAFSPDGTALATGGRASPRPDPSLVQLWDPATGRERATLEGHGDWVESIAFSPDGTILASGSHDETVRLWDASSGMLRRVLRQGCTVESLTFSPDGRLLAVGSEQGIVRLWDHEDSLMLATLPASAEPVYALDFAPDGQTLATGSHDGTVRLWDVEALVREAEATLAETPGGPFVLLADRGDDADRRFGSLEAAVANAPAGGTIEIRGDGPFLLPASGIHLTRPMTIRAGDGYVPVLQQEADARPGERRSKFLLHVLGPVTLEGLVLDRTGAHEVAEQRSVILVQGVPLRVANCRIRPHWPQNFAIWADRSPDIELRNTIIDGVCGDVIVPNQCQAGDRIALVNCLVSPGVERNVVAFPIQPNPIEFLRIEFLGNTFGSSLVALRPEDRIGRLEIRAEQNIIVHDVILTLWGQPRESGEEALKERFRWHGRRNLLPADLPLVCFDDRPLDRWRTLDAWNRLWGNADAGSIVGPPRFEHLTSHRQLAHAEDPTEWRLAPDSPGARAGDDGQDLGADVDLVGPGEAFGRWKATPEYARWASSPPEGR